MRPPLGLSLMPKSAPKEKGLEGSLWALASAVPAFVAIGWGERGKRGTPGTELIDVAPVGLLALGATPKSSSLA